MPFKRASDKYVSLPTGRHGPSGRKYTKKQVALYYATEGFKKKPRKIKKK